jgi:hypothetical protein
VFEQVPNAPAEAALAELNGRWEPSSPMETAESREADAEELGTLSSAENALQPQTVRQRLMCRSSHFLTFVLWLNSQLAKASMRANQQEVFPTDISRYTRNFYRLRFT